MSTNYHTDPDEYMTRPDGEPIKFEAPPEVEARRAAIEKQINEGTATRREVRLIQGGVDYRLDWLSRVILTIFALSLLANGLWFVLWLLR